MYSGICSDRFIVEASGFLQLLRPGDQLMVDKEFRIADFLNCRQCTLALPPFAKRGMQMFAKNVQITSRVANARIYVENTIERAKKAIDSMTFLPLVDDIVTCYCIFTNLSEPFCI